MFTARYGLNVEIRFV